MPYKIAYNPNLRIIEITYWGEITIDELVQTIWDTARVLAETKSSLVLNDFRGTTLEMPITEIYLIPDKISEIMAATGGKIYNIRRAIVHDGFEETFRFFETTSVNRGHRVKKFHDIEEARKWLLNQ